MSARAGTTLPAPGCLFRLSLHNEVSSVSDRKNFRRREDVFSVNIRPDFLKIESDFLFGARYNGEAHLQKISCFLRCRSDLLRKQLKLFFQKAVQNSGIIVGMGKTAGAFFRRFGCLFG